MSHPKLTFIACWKCWNRSRNKRILIDKSRFLFINTIKIRWDAHFIFKWFVRVFLWRFIFWKFWFFFLWLVRVVLWSFVFNRLWFFFLCFLIRSFSRFWNNLVFIRWLWDNSPNSVIDKKAKYDHFKDTPGWTRNGSIGWPSLRGYIFILWGISNWGILRRKLLWTLTF